ncbi:SIMPL domain-containing protein [Thalassotalea profundi]|uniref:SIMPL domain-containing protein n=1 Tax=Thalassotalea profundi TaxID=2036687 RepID=A0ABQ3IQ44_9GAMM|nr:SIMPL domain-containing protein [Thalassotalea profundi]GHE91006.1 SIMPL domain-containing protein [Thalassotalea profundi]
MQNTNRLSSSILGLFIFLGLTTLGFLLANAVIEYKQYERTITVKGLSEKEFKADIVLWPIQFIAASNELDALYNAIETSTTKINAFLTDKGIDVNEISFSAPAITDKSAQQYGSSNQYQYRYTAMQTVTVYSTKIGIVRELMGALSELGKQGIVFTGDNYQSQTEYIFTRLNDVKPDMVEEATRKAREVAEKFASDSDSKLGKIKKAVQGQFSIRARDKNNPHIKMVRVVSTIEYYLSD